MERTKIYALEWILKAYTRCTQTGLVVVAAQGQPVEEGLAEIKAAIDLSGLAINELRIEPKTRIGKWVPVKTDVLKRGDKFMIHPEDQFVYRVYEISGDRCLGSTTDGNLTTAGKWVYVEIS